MMTIRTIWLGIVITLSSCSSTMCDNRFIEKWETGRLSLQDIRQKPDVSADLITFLEFINEYWYGYNVDQLDIFNGAINMIDSNTTWYNTVRFIHHSQLRDLKYDELMAFYESAQRLDSNHINIYLNIYKLFLDMEIPCDSQRVIKDIQNKNKEFGRFNFFRSLKANALLSIGLGHEALQVAKGINYKQREDIGYFLMAIINKELGNTTAYNKHMDYIIYDVGKLEYLLERVMNYITVQEDKEAAAKIMDSIEFSKNSQYFITQGYLTYSDGDLYGALDEFRTAFTRSQKPDDLFDYFWLSISMRLYENLEGFFDYQNLRDLDWFKAYHIVYLVEYQKAHVEAKLLFESFDTCTKRLVKQHLLPFDDVLKVIEY